MTWTLDDEVLIRRYLLGNVTDDEQRQVEERLISDDDYYNYLCRSEADLIDEYVRGALAADDRLRFERHFSNAPDRRKSVAFGGVFNACLSTRVAQTAETQAATVQLNAPLTHTSWRGSLSFRSALPYLATFIAVALALAVALLVIKTTELRKQIEQSKIEKAALEEREDSLRARLADEAARSNAPTQELKRERLESSRKQEPVNRQRPATNPVQIRLVSLALAPGLSRGEDERRTAVLWPHTRQLRLDLIIGNPLFDRYEAELQKAAEFKKGLPLPARRTTDGRTVVVTIPARMLTRSDYIVTLFVPNNGERTIVATYSFNVKRK